MLLVTGSFIARDGCLDEAIALSIEHVRRSRLEGGCLAHGVHQDVENPSRLVFIEQWTDQAALCAHFAVPASNAFVRAVTALAAGTPELAVFDAKRIKL